MARRRSGPWTTLFYGPFVPPGAAPDPRIFTAQVVIKWSYDRVAVGDVERRAAAERLQRSRERQL